MTMNKHAQFLRIITGWVLGLCLVVFLSGCALLGKKKPSVPEATLPTWIGRIIMVDIEHQFALVDTGASLRVAPETRLLSFRDQRRTALLTATAETRPPYIAVEITEGLPSLGDQVALDESRPPSNSTEPNTPH